MTTAKLKRRFSRPVRDFALGLTVFAGSSLACGTNWIENTGVLSGAAQAGRFEEDAISIGAQVSGAVIAMPGPVLGSPEHMSMFLSLALGFAGVFALNLWFARHVQRVHASYRRDRR